MQFLLTSFLLSLFIIKAPPFYVFPIASRIFSSHTLAKVTIVLVFTVFYFLKKAKIHQLVRENKTIFILLFLYFLGQSISILVASDISLFWKSYHNLISSILIFLLAFFIINIQKNKLQTINYFILIIGFILVLFELLFFLFPYQLLGVFKIIMQKEVLDSYLTNLSRGRLSPEINNEIFLPFFLWLLFFPKQQSILKTVLLILISSILIYLSFVSNFRSRVVLAIFLLAAFFFIASQQKKRAISFFLVITCIIIGFAVITSNYLHSFNIFDRFVLADVREDAVTVGFRVNAAIKSMNLFISSPFFGIGLGNYIDDEFLKLSSGFSPISSNYIKNYLLAVAYSPHNILAQVLAETGLFGFIPYIMLLGYFLMQDYKILKSTNLELMPHILSSWAIFIFMNFNPGSTIFISGWFWFLRGVIVGKKGYL